MTLTCVSGYWKIKNKHDNKYEDWFKNTLKISLPYIFFGDKESIELVKKYRGNLPTYFIELNIEEFITYKYKGNMITHPIHCPSIELNLIWNEKIFMIQRSVKINPFLSEFFMWIDAGICTYRTETNPSISFPDIKNKLNNLPKDKFIYSSSNHKVYNEQGFKKDMFHLNHHVSGTSYIIHKNIVSKFSRMYENYLKLIDKNDIWTDQVILTMIYKDNKELFYKLCDGYGSILRNLKMLKVLHISFHKGCQNDIEYLSKKLNFKLDFMLYSDYTVIGNDVYNITHDRALNNWNKNKDYYNSFDIIITSDTAPLSRIFLQNNFQKKLIIWICNRFDYAHQPDATKIGFPDKEYYDLINDVKNKPNVSIIGYTPFETYYANHIRKLDIGNECIKPIGKISNVYNNYISTQLEDKKNTFIIGPYHNDNIMMDLKSKVESLGIKVFNGRYNGPRDLQEFAGVIHIPYAWSNLALFEAIQQKIVIFIPSLNFLKYLIHLNVNPLLKYKCFSSSSDMCFDLSFFEIIKKIIFIFIKYLIEKFYINNLKKGKFFWSPPLIEEQLHLSEWYCKDFKDALIYFDSWDDLKHKISNLDFNKQKSILKQLGKKHEEEMLNKWKQYIN